jgi:hypothetical protein
MAGKKSGGAIPVGVLLAGLHVLFDLATHAACPACGTQVVLYVCPNCVKPVWPNRDDGLAA